ncbi:MAG: tetratricopeptide repeat protein, partial [Desulfomonilaceae bacterium]
MRISCLLVGITLLICTTITQVFAQDANQGAIILNQSSAFLKNAKSKEDLEKARDGFQKAYEIFLRTRNLKEAAIAASQIGFVKSRLGDLKGALDYYDKVYKYMVSAKDLASAWKTRFNMAEIYERLGQYSESQKALNEVLELCGQPGDPACLRAALDGLGSINWRKGNLKEAL